MLRLFFALMYLLFACPAFAALPTQLSGPWENPEKNRRGTLTVFITHQDHHRLEGTILITGSHSCKDPISFLGEISSGRITIASNAENVCGRSGKFSVEVTREHEALYVGTFSYLWMGGVWASGTFQLVPGNSSN